MSRMKEHAVILQDDGLVLRPMTEADWELVLRINNDPDLAYYTEGDDWTEYALEESNGSIVQSLSRRSCLSSSVKAIPSANAGCSG